MPLQPAILGTARLGNFRLGYEPAALQTMRQTLVRITLAGVAVRPVGGSVTVHDEVNDAPNTCALSLYAPPTPPVPAQPIRITINSDAPRLLFSGALETVDLSYVGLPGQVIYPCTALDDTPRATRRLPFGSWTNVSATTVAQALIASFAPGFTAVHVQADLPPVSINLDGSEGLNGALSQIAQLIGGYFYWEDSDLHLFLDEATETPDDLDSTPRRFLDDPPIRLDQNDNQIRTRVYGKGHGEATLADVPAGFTTIPIANAVGWFNPLGGLAISETQRLTYAGLQAGGDASAMVGRGQSPSAPPSLALQAGSGLGTGVYHYAYTDITASGESLPSPLKAITTGLTAAPANTMHLGVPTPGTGPDTGNHTYVVTFTTSAGETTPSQAVTPVITGAVVPAPSAALSFTSPSSPGNLSEGTYQWAMTWVVAGGGETTPSPLFTFTLSGAPVGQGSAMTLTRQATPPVGATSANVYRTTVNGSQLKLVVSNLIPNFFPYFDNLADGSLGANAPTVNTTHCNVVPITAIPLGESLTTGRKLYRQFNGTGPFKLVATIADNVTTLFMDTVPNASLGALAPSTNTAAARQVVVSGIANGPTPTISRKLYRTAVDGSQLQLLTTLADNLTSTYNDSTADGSLGANAPTSDTSALPQASGQVTAGATALSLTGLGGFPATNGWALVGSQVIRYTGISSGVAPPPGPAPTVSNVLVSGASLPPGTYQYAYTLLTSAGETLPSAAATVTTTTGHGAEVVFTPAVFAETTFYGIYRTAAGGSQLQHLIYLPLPRPIPVTFFDVGFSTLSANAPTADTSGLIYGNMLTGIPPTGSGSLVGTIPFNTPVMSPPLLTGVTGLVLPLVKGAPVNIWVQRDDLAAQAALAAADGSDGIVEHLIVDERRNEASLGALCDADLALFARAIHTVTYATRDTKTKSGKPITINLASPAIAETLTIQTVDISEINTAAGTPPKFTVSASSVRFSMDAILRKLTKALGS